MGSRAMFVRRKAKLRRHDVRRSYGNRRGIGLRESRTDSASMRVAQALTAGSFLTSVNTSRPSAATDPGATAIRDLIAVHVLIRGPEREIVIGIRGNAHILAPERIGFILPAGAGVGEDQFHGAKFA